MISKPTFVSLGDPSGIGPEVFIKAINDQKLRKHLSKIILVSSSKVIEGAISAIGVKQKDIKKYFKVLNKALFKNMFKILRVIQNF